MLRNAAATVAGRGQTASRREGPARARGARPRRRRPRLLPAAPPVAEGRRDTSAVSVETRADGRPDGPGPGHPVNDERPSRGAPEADVG